MMEYFAYKKFKKHRDEKSQTEVANGAKTEDVASPSSASPLPAPSPSPAVATSPMPSSTNALAMPAPVLSDHDEAWFERVLAAHDATHDDEGPAPPLPPRVKTPDLSWEHSDDDRSRKSVELAVADKKGKGKKEAVAGLARTASKRITAIFAKDKKTGHLAPPQEDETLTEEEREQRDMTRVLDNLNLAAKNDKAFSLSTESTELVRKFTVVLKDLVNGVPTAYGDLTGLLDDRDGLLARNFEKLPSSLKKLVTQLPTKLTSTLAPELLAAAAEAQGVKVDSSEEGGGIKGAAKKLLMPGNLQELITKPGALVGMLKAIMNALKVRWPAFMGTNVLWSLALFLLLFVLWYCHKRGREVRLEKEKTDASGIAPIADSDRVEELPDDPALPAPSSASRPIVSPVPSSQISPRTEITPPLVGEPVATSSSRP